MKVGAAFKLPCRAARQRGRWRSSCSSLFHRRDAQPFHQADSQRAAPFACRLCQTLGVTGIVLCSTPANSKPDLVKQMSSCTTLRIAVASLLLVVSAVSAAPLHKCTVNGTVTYQQGPCPSDEARKTPTIQELNAESKKKRESAASAPAETAAPQYSKTTGACLPPYPLR